jgi:hypothetical protein
MAAVAEEPFLRGLVLPAFDHSVTGIAVPVMAHGIHDVVA